MFTGIPQWVHSEDDIYVYEDAFHRFSAVPKDIKDQRVLGILCVESDHWKNSLKKELVNPKKEDDLIKGYLRKYLLECLAMRAFIKQNLSPIPRNLENTVKVSQQWAQLSKLEYRSDSGKAVNAVDEFIASHSKALLDAFKAENTP